jgi:transposase
MPDFAELHRQRQCHPHVTQHLVWEEYRKANPDGYRYSRFCELYQRWRRKQDVVLNFALRVIYLQVGSPAL